MRIVSLNGAAFIFLQRSERLKENLRPPHNKFPDRRYILWPRSEGWDVRVKVNQFSKVVWKPIAEPLFCDIDAPWLAANEHLEGQWQRKKVKICDLIFSQIVNLTRIKLSY